MDPEGRLQDSAAIEQIRGWGLAISSLEVTGFRDPENGEIVFPDGARTRLTCGVVSMEMMTLTYELASTFPEDEAKAPKESRYLQSHHHLGPMARRILELKAEIREARYLEEPGMETGWSWSDC